MLGHVGPEDISFSAVSVIVPITRGLGGGGQTHIRTRGGGTHSSPNVISMQMKGAGIRESKDGHESPTVAMGTEISYHQSQVGHEADELGAESETGSSTCSPERFQPLTVDVAEYFYHNAPRLIYPPNIHIRVGFSAAACCQQGAAEVT